MTRITLALAALALAAAGCSGGSEPAAAPSSAVPTRLAGLDTTALTVARAEFCARVAPAAVAQALGAEADRTVHWTNGDRAPVATGVTDVAHEFGCRWASPDGTAVQGWVFAPPVTPGQAERLRNAAATAKGCRPAPRAPKFGSRSIAVRCDDGTTSFHGLFGDAWLSCSLTTQGDHSLERTARWCVAVVQAASTGPG